MLIKKIIKYYVFQSVLFGYANAMYVMYVWVYLLLNFPIDIAKANVDNRYSRKTKSPKTIYINRNIDILIITIRDDDIWLQTGVA